MVLVFLIEEFQSLHAVPKNGAQKRRKVDKANI